MMEFVFIIALMFLFLISLGAPPTQKRSECPPHKWDYNLEGRLQCTVCKQVPGGPTGYDKPY